MGLTKKQDLKTGTPLWLGGQKPILPSAPLRPNSKIDVIVVGTGISGALVADALVSAGLSVLAIDRREPMSGSTPASTALLQGELDLPLMHLQKMRGKQAAARIWLRSAQAVQVLADKIADLSLRCNFRARTSLYLPGNVLNIDELRKEADARVQCGLRTQFIDAAELNVRTGLAKPGAILSRGNAEADPVKLTGGLWRRNIERGGAMMSGMEVTSINQSRSHVRLELADGSYVTAGRAVFCTGYEFLEGVKPKEFKVISTWVLATRPQPEKLWKDKSLIWGASDPYVYLRTTADGRIIAGGEDEPFSDPARRDAMTAKKVKAIAAKAAKLFPEADFTPDFAWSGSFGESPTGAPAIGPLKAMPRVYAVMGFGGNGITFSMLAAQLVVTS